MILPNVYIFYAYQSRRVHFGSQSKIAYMICMFYWLNGNFVQNFMHIGSETKKLAIYCHTKFDMHYNLTLPIFVFRKVDSHFAQYMD